MTPEPRPHPGSVSDWRAFQAIPALGNGRPLVRISNLTKSYRGVKALDDLTLDLPAGRIIGLMGSNGSGKTTLLKILAGVLADYDGQVLIDGSAPGPRTKSMVSFLPDAAFLSSSLTAPAAIAMFARLFTDFDAAKAADLVGFFKLPTDRSLKEMSKGMGEKMRIALAMSRKARVYLLDEPISGIDPATRQVIVDGILRDFDEDSLMVISTHLITDIEPVIDSAVFLSRGRTLLAGDVDDLRQASGLGLDALFRKEYR